MSLKLTPNTTNKVLISLLFSTLVYLYFPYVQNYSITPKWVALSVIGMIAVWFVKPLRLNKVHFFWSLFVVQYFIQCFFSYNFWDAFAYGIPFIIAPSLVQTLLDKRLSTEALYRNIAFISAIVIGPILIYSLFEITLLYLSNDFSHAKTYDFRFTFGHRNQFSQFITLLVPLMALGVFFETKKTKKIFLLTVIVLIFLTATLLRSRTTLIILFFVYPLCGSIFLLSRLKGKLKTYFKYGIGTLLIVAFSVSFYIPKSEIPILNKLTETNFGSGNERIRLWSNSIEIIKENPFFGKGSGDWKIEILRTPLSYTQAEDSVVFYRRAHNDFLQIGVENGLFGLLLYLLFFTTAILQIVKSSVAPTVKTILISGILAFLVISCFSFPLEKLEHLFILFLFIIPVSYSNSERRNTKFLRPLLFLILSIAFVFSVKWLLEEKKYAKFIESNNIEIIEGINRNFYAIDPTSLPLEWYLANNYFEKGEYNKAINSYTTSLALNPNHVHAINNLGSSYYNLNKINLAEIEYKKALDINPLFTETLMNYSSLCFNTNRIDDALGLILKVKENQEPETYKMYISAIGSKKISLMIENEDNPLFKNYLYQNRANDDFLYEIAIKCRASGFSYENQIRHIFIKNHFNSLIFN